VIRYII